MPDKARYYIVERDAIPEVLIKVVQAKKLLETKKVQTVAEAADQVGISRSSFYKYKDSIAPFFESSRGKTITLSLKLDDEPGILAQLLSKLSETQSNILTIHQTIPINGIANVTISAQLLENYNEDMQPYLDILKSVKGVHDIKILARE